MLAFEVYLNGKKICTAGVGEPGVLSSIITWVLSDDVGQPKRKEGKEGLGVQVGGLVSRTQQHLDWLKRPLRRGDELSVRIVEADEVDLPKKSRRPESPAQRRQRQEAHVRELAKQFGWKIEEQGSP